jgi:hypothetical protein
VNPETYSATAEFALMNNQTFTSKMIIQWPKTSSKGGMGKGEATSMKTNTITVPDKFSIT